MNSGKNLELVDLEAHVLLCDERRLVLEEKIARVERDLKEITDQAIISRRLFLGSVVSILSGIISTIVAISMRHPL